MANVGSYLFKELESEQLTQLVDEALGKSLACTELCDGGLFNTTYRIETDDKKKYILRVGPVNRERLMYYEVCMMSAEAWLFERLEEIGVPCSHVVKMGVFDDREYMIVDCIDAKPMSLCKLTDDQRRKIDSQVRYEIAKLHTLRGESFGRVAEVLQGRGYSDWYSYILGEAVILTDQGVEWESFTRGEADRIVAAVKASREALSEVREPMLTHGDLWGGNILVSFDESGEPQLAAIIDVDRAVYGDVDYDLGWVDTLVDGKLVRPQDSENRNRRREIYGMFYTLFEAHVWHLQYQNDEIAGNAKKRLLETCDRLVNAE